MQPGMTSVDTKDMFSSACIISGTFSEYDGEAALKGKKKVAENLVCFRHCKRFAI